MTGAAAPASTLADPPASIAPVSETLPQQVDVKAEFERAVALHQSRRLVEAEEIYRLVLERQPQHPGALHLMGVIDIQRGRHAAAVEKIAAAIARNPRAAPFHGNLATALQALGRLEEAQKHYLEAVRLDPNYADAHNNLGALLEKRARHREALASYRAALKARPNFAEAHQNLGQLLRVTGALEESVKHLREAIRLRPDYAEARVGLGDARQAKGQFDEAIDEYKKALAIEPANARVYLGMGKIYYNEKQLYHEAVAAYQQAIVMDAIRRGARDFVVKPFSPERVLGAVAKLLSA